MYKKLDTILTIRPEQTPPQYLSDCFTDEKSGVRSMAGLKILSVVALKSFIVLLAIGFALNVISTLQ